ncbi:unnamed protein product [Peniophora sp. CBMAI 1063]|nr:unnamed protein product [Peniophora sp. CBMAI 1063]
MDPQQPTISPVFDHDFNSPDADLILRSCDGIDFAVHTTILRLISSVFGDMLSMPPEKNDDTAPSRPTVDMSEDAQSLRLLLKCCYPRSSWDEPELTVLLDIKRAATFAHKYNIEYLNKKASKALLRYSDVSPSLAYAVSWRFGYAEPLRAAARRSLDIPDFFKSIADSQDTIEFEEIPATALMRLYRYHCAVRPRLESAVLTNSREHPVSWVLPRLIDAQLLHGTATGNEPMCACALTVVWMCVEGLEKGLEFYVYSWWWEYVHAVIAIMQSERRPGIDTALEEPLFECMRSALSCNTCNGGAVASRVLAATRVTLRRAIEDGLHSVSD